MFVDYYSILEINENATISEIKEAFRRQASKWHPDRNLGRDTTVRMQQINEAYLILKDGEARARYDIEYQRFKLYQQQRKKQQQQQKQQQHSQAQETQREAKYEYNDYHINDDVLNKWINNAKKQAAELAKQAIEDFTGMAAAGAKAAGETMLDLVKVFAAVIVVIVLVKIFSGSGSTTSSGYKSNFPPPRSFEMDGDKYSVEVDKKGVSVTVNEEKHNYPIAIDTLAKAAADDIDTRTLNKQKLNPADEELVNEASEVYGFILGAEINIPNWCEPYYKMTKHSAAFKKYFNNRKIKAEKILRNAIGERFIISMTKAPFTFRMATSSRRCSHNKATIE